MIKRISVCALLLACLCPSALAQLPTGFQETKYMDVDQPMAMAYAPDGRLFVCQRFGNIRIIKNGALLPASFASVNVSQQGERGLSGIALDPAFSTNGFVYIYYTTSSTSMNPPATPKNRISRFTANGDVAVAGSETIILDNIPSDSGFHNGGGVQFGGDGKLYISIGDSGTASNGQSLATIAGKVLRLNSNGTIPTDNPFFGQAGVRQEIYQYGLRNPFRIRFRPGTNVLYIADVGEGAWEEINVGPAGANFGWSTYEGPTTDPNVVTPLHAYDHPSSPGGGGASITGGTFIENHTWPAAYQSNYFYGDYIDQFVRRLVVTAQNTLVQAASFGPATRPVDFIQGLDGDLYYADLNAAALRRIWYSGVSAGFTITTDKTSANGGDPIQINWTVPAGRPSTDWVGIFKIGDPNTAARWSQSTGGTATGSANATVPNESGTFEVRYLDNSNVVLGRSTHILVTAVVLPFALTPSSTNLEVEKPLSVSWTAPSGRPANDWIGLYRIGDPNQNFIWWQYTGGATSGTFFLTSPATPGQYDFRYLLNNGYTDAVRSAAITVTASTSTYTLSASPGAVNPGASVTVNWTAPAGSSAVDWIGLYHAGDPENRNYISWFYTGGATSGSRAVTMPTATGDYVFRYLLDNGYTHRATSNNVTVALGYSLSATPSSAGPGQNVTVSWTAPSGGSSTDWIGLFRVGDDHRQWIAYTYTNGATSGSHVFKMPTQTGQYEFRYLLNNGYTDLRATSNTVTVQ